MNNHLNDIDEIYRETILDLNRHPLNKKKLDVFDIQHKENNPLCGDEVELFIKLTEGKISDVGFQGDGCAISQASVSLLTDHIKGMTKVQLLEITRDEVLDLLGMKGLNPARQRCALLGLKTLQRGAEEGTKN
jgi:nitrogen fixation NifU-like protein